MPLPISLEDLTLVVDIPGATRLFGADRFETNQAVLGALTFKYDHVYVADGTDAHLVDSLVASSLAAKSNSPIVFNDPHGNGANIIYNKLDSMAFQKPGIATAITALGGHTLVSDTDVRAMIPVYYQPPLPEGGSSSDNATPAVTAVTGISLNYPTLSLTPGGANRPTGCYRISCHCYKPDSDLGNK